jgi:hypothetical protein
VGPARAALQAGLAQQSLDGLVADGKALTEHEFGLHAARSRGAPATPGAPGGCGRSARRGGSLGPMGGRFRQASEPDSETPTTRQATCTDSPSVASTAIAAHRLVGQLPP